MSKAPILPRLADSRANQAQGEIDLALRDVTQSPVVRGVMTGQKRIVATGETMYFDHKLGRMPIGWEIARFLGAFPSVIVTEVNARRIVVESRAGAAGESTFAWWVY